MAASLDSVTDKELYDLIEKANLADRLLNDPAYKMLQEASNRIVERAVNEFALKSKISPKPEDLARLIELQVIIKKYKFGLFNEVKVLKQESEFAYEEARERGLVGDFLENVKKKIGL